jgi:hypothetical protein
VTADDPTLSQRISTMATMSPISVSLEYRTKESLTWKSIALSPEEYFDLEQNETVSWDSVPRHNHASDYLNVELAIIRNTRLTVVDAQAKLTQQITEAFWKGGTNRVVERTDNGPDGDYWELIVEVRVSDEPVVWEILRLDRLNGVIAPNYHGFIQLRDDGSEKETKVEGGTHGKLQTPMITNGTPKMSTES